jgi:hypothetical protein
MSRVALVSPRIEGRICPRTRVDEGEHYLGIPPNGAFQHSPVSRKPGAVHVKVGTRRYLSVSVDISTHGAKVRTKALPKTGTTVELEILPPQGPPLKVGALAWRVDTNGQAFLFSQDIQHPLIRVV